MFYCTLIEGHQIVSELVWIRVRPKETFLND